MSDIPAARQLLRDALIHTAPGSPVADRINQALAKMTRKPSQRRRAPANSVEMTASLCREIRAYSNAAPRATLQDIATRFNVNIGRVSEALNGVPA